MKQSILSLVLLAALGCGQTGQEGDLFGGGLFCLPVNDTQLNINEVSALGFSGTNVLSRIAAAYSGTLDYDDGTQSTLNLSVAHTDGLAYFSERDKPIDAPPELECPNVVRVEVDISFATGDGLFNDTWSGSLLAPEITGRVTAFSEIGFGQLAGAYKTPASLGPLNGVGFFFGTHFENQQGVGELNGYGAAQTTDSMGVEFPVGAWTVSAP